MTSIKNALALKRRHPDLPVFCIHRDLLASGIAAEEIYREAMQEGVRFCREGKRSRYLR